MRKRSAPWTKSFRAFWFDDPRWGDFSEMKTTFGLERERIKATLDKRPLARAIALAVETLQAAITTDVDSRIPASGELAFSKLASSNLNLVAFCVWAPDFPSHQNPVQKLRGVILIFGNGLSDVEAVFDLEAFACFCNNGIAVSFDEGNLI